MQPFRIFLFLLLILPFALYSQIKIRGKVLDSLNEKPIQAAIVQIVDTSGSIVDYDFTDSTGNFTLSLKLPGIKIIASSLGYTSKTDAISETNNIKNLIILLLPAPHEMKEVVVKSFAPRDTVAIQYDSSTFTKNATLYDILKKNDQLTINENGTIIYRGRKINKILVNKKEVFVNQNSIALQNITNEIIKKLDIITNYKDKYDVNFDNFKEVVLNVDTKDQFKGKIINSVMAGGGYRNSYEALHRLFYFSHSFNAFAMNFSNNGGIRQQLENNFFYKYQYARSDYFTSYLQKALASNENRVKDIAHAFVGGLKIERPKTKYNFNYIVQFSNAAKQSDIRTYVYQGDTTFQSQKIQGDGRFFYGNLESKTLIKKNISLSNSLSGNASFYSNLESYQNSSSLSYFNLTNKNSLIENTNELTWRFKNKYIWNTKLFLLSETNREHYAWSTDTGFNASAAYTLHNQAMQLESFVNRRFSPLLNFKILGSAKLRNYNLQSTHYKLDFQSFSLGVSGNGQNRTIQYFLTCMTDEYKAQGQSNNISLNWQSEVLLHLFRNTSLSSQFTWKYLPNILSPFVQNFMLNSRFYIVQLPSYFTLYQLLDGSVEIYYHDVFKGYYAGAEFSQTKKRNYLLLQPQWINNSYFFTPQKLDVFSNTKYKVNTKKQIKINTINVLKVGAQYSFGSFISQYNQQGLSNLFQKNTEWSVSAEQQWSKGLMKQAGISFTQSDNFYRIQDKASSAEGKFLFNTYKFSFQVIGIYRKMEFSATSDFIYSKTDDLQTKANSLNAVVYLNTTKKISWYIKLHNLLALFDNKNYTLLTYYNASNRIEVKEAKLLSYGIIGAQIRF